MKYGRASCVEYIRLGWTEPPAFDWLPDYRSTGPPEIYPKASSLHVKRRGLSASGVLSAVKANGHLHFPEWRASPHHIGPLLLPPRTFDFSLGALRFEPAGNRGNPGCAGRARDLPPT